MGEVRAGVVLVTKFMRPKSRAYSGYIDYIDRDEAVRNKFSDKWNGYVDYMGDPEKTSELFSSSCDKLSNAEKQHLKHDFLKAQEKGHLMWQTVLSFDNRWLEKEGLYDSVTGTVNADQIKGLTRNCMKKMLEKEGITESAVWSASIHYNTDNIHIHIATVEPEETLRPMREDGEPKGVWRQSTLKAGKAVVVNNILMQQEENRLINNLIRKNIVGAKKEKTIAYDRDLREAFLKVYHNLPSNKQHWNYNSTNLGNLNRMNLDTLSRLYIQKFHQQEYSEFQEAVKKQQEKYREAYGNGEKAANRYAENKEKELFERLGNTILKEMKEYDKELTKERIASRQLSNYYLSKELNSRTLAEHDTRTAFHVMGHALNKMNKAFKKDFQSMKNQTAYEKLQQQIELHQKGYDDVEL